MTTYTLTEFQDGDTIKASEFNENFQYCLADTTTKVGALQSNVQSSINSINGNISNLGSSKASTDLNDTVSGAFENVVALAQASGQATVTNWMMPNLSAGTSVARGVSYTASADGWLYVYAQANAKNVINFQITVAGQVIAQTYNGTGINDGAGALIPVPKDAVYVFTSNDSYGSQGVFYPCKGV